MTVAEWQRHGFNLGADCTANNNGLIWIPRNWNEIKSNYLDYIAAMDELTRIYNEEQKQP